MKGKMKIKVLMLAIAALVSLVSLTSVSCIRLAGLQGSGNVVSEERSVSGFNAVAVSSGMNLYLRQGDTEYCKLETDDNIISQIVTEVKNEKLVIEYKNFLGGISTRKPVNVYVTVKNLNEVSASSGSRVESELINSNSLEINMGSGSNGEFIVSTRSLDVGLSSGSQLEVSGETQSQNVDLSSGVTYNAEDLTSMNAELDVSSGAQAKIMVSDSLDVDISSGGSVEYSGSPQVTSNISSGGSLKNN